MSRRARLSFFFAITVVAIVATFLFPRFDINPSYHNFADGRAWLGIPNFGDVASNLAFLAAGLYGLVITLRRRHVFEDQGEIAAYVVLFLGILLTTFGSSYYHLLPNNERLLWDRLPMSVAFMGLFAAILSERVSARVGFRLLPLLILVGIGSLTYWIWSVHQGSPDLRPYLLVQFYPLAAILFLLGLFPARYTRGYDFLIALGFYVAAKVFEVADKPIFAATGHIVSGHTLKHIAAGIGGYWLGRMVALRHRVDVLPT